LEKIIETRKAHNVIELDLDWEMLELEADEE